MKSACKIRKLSTKCIHEKCMNVRYNNMLQVRRLCTEIENVSFYLVCFRGKKFSHDLLLSLCCLCHSVLVSLCLFLSVSMLLSLSLFLSLPRTQLIN